MKYYLITIFCKSTQDYSAQYFNYTSKGTIISHEDILQDDEYYFSKAIISVSEISKSDFEKLDL